MVKLSFSCIGHNEKEHLLQLIPELLKWGDEVVYVDCESSDNSYEYAEKAGCRVFRRANNTNLNVNKSFGIDKAHGEWVFYIDPDERIPTVLMEEIHQIISSDPIENGFSVARKNFFFGQWLKYGCQYPDYQLRLFRKNKGRFLNRHVHEKLQVEGKIGQLSNCMVHYPYITTRQFLHKFDFYTSFDAHYMNNEGTEIHFGNHLKFLFYKPLTRFVKRYIVKRGYKDGIPGFFAAFFDAAGWIVRYIRLWELSKNKRVSVL